MEILEFVGWVVAVVVITLAWCFALMPLGR
jgi:hypothetical protein